MHYCCTIHLSVLSDTTGGNINPYVFHHSWPSFHPAGIFPQQKQTTDSVSTNAIGWQYGGDSVVLLSCYVLFGKFVFCWMEGKKKLLARRPANTKSRVPSLLLLLNTASRQ